MSSFGRTFRVTTFGESHCKAVGVIVDGVPPRLPLSEEDIQVQLTRRRPGQSKLSTPRNEQDAVTILSGVERGLTLGTPICMMVKNKDARPQDYGSTRDNPRPSHADMTYLEKYGIHAASGGGRSSARETIGRVAAGALAEKWLKIRYGIEIVAFVGSVGTQSIDPADVNLDSITRDEVDANFPVRSGTAEAVERFSKEIEACKHDRDSTGGTVTCVCRHVPSGWGEPCFDKLEAMLAHAMLSIPATKGFEIGSGFQGTSLRGSQHNDMFVRKGNRLGTTSNNSGGIQGGISNGENIVFRIAFKPPATIGKEQPSADYAGTDGVVQAKGRHDPCVVPRAVPIVEAMAALVLADMAMLQEARIASQVSPVPDIFQGATLETSESVQQLMDEEAQDDALDNPEYDTDKLNRYLQRQNAEAKRLLESYRAQMGSLEQRHEAKLQEANARTFKERERREAAQRQSRINLALGVGLLMTASLIMWQRLK